jgi:predicted TIM-barrel fold metal-dependent hydrolase
LSSEIQERTEKWIREMDAKDVREKFGGGAKEIICWTDASEVYKKEKG